MRVAILAGEDNSNVGYRIMRAFAAVGCEVAGGKLIPHPFQYPEELPVMPRAKLKFVTAEADVVVFAHTFKLQDAVIRKDAVKIVLHSGSRYAKKQRRVNTIWNKQVSISLIDTPLHMNRGAKNQQFFVSPVDIDELAARYCRTKYKRKFGFFPHDLKRKGADVVIPTLKNLEGQFPELEFRESADKLVYAEHIKRVSECDVLIEQIGDPYGPGVAAFEAAATGKLVITDTFRFAQYYREAYGQEPPFEAAMSASALNVSVEHLMSLDKDEFTAMQHAVRDQIQRLHSMEATGKRLLELIEQCD